MTNQIIELVLYKLTHNPIGVKEIILNQTNDALSELNGFLYRKVYQDSEDPYIFLDFVVWENKDDANEAASSKSSNKKLSNFVNLIDKTIIFEYFNFDNKHSINEKETDKIELTVYELKEGDNFLINLLFSSFSNEIEKVKGYNNRILLQSLKNDTYWAEKIYWDSIEMAKESEENLKHNPYIIEVNKIISKNVVIKNYFNAFI